MQEAERQRWLEMARQDIIDRGGDSKSKRVNVAIYEADTREKHDHPPPKKKKTRQEQAVVLAILYNSTQIDAPPPHTPTPRPPLPMLYRPPSLILVGYDGHTFLT